MHRCIFNDDNTNNEIANDTGGKYSNEENRNLEMRKQKTVKYNVDVRQRKANVEFDSVTMPSCAECLIRKKCLMCLSRYSVF